MLIENPDAFKAWLTSVLEPLCDADPEALAKYVYALVRKDRPIEALREGMVEQLDVFLQKETKPFVELLFKTLEKQEYLQQPDTPIPNTNPSNPNIPPVIITKPDVPEVVTTTKEVKPIIPVSSLPDLTFDTVNGTATTIVVTTPLVKKDVIRENETPLPLHRKEREHKKSESEKDEKVPIPIRTGRLRHRSNSRNRSRSRSWDRSRRSRSRDRSRERERRDRSRPWRNKSPPRRYERRRSRSNSPLIQRNRSPRHAYRGRYRNRSPPRSHSRSRSRSLDKEKTKDHKEPLSGAGTPTQDSNHGDTDMRLISSTQSIQSVVANADVNSSSGNFVPNNTIGPVFHGKRRCRDFDEKGYCMRGDMCPYDHGVDPVVLENTALSNVLTFGPNGQPPLEGPPATEMLPPPMIRPNSGHVMHGHHMPHRPMHPGIPPEYNPSAPSMWNARSGFRGGPIAGPPRPGMFHGGPGMPLLGGPQQGGLGAPPGPHNHVQRELISVPVMDNSSQHMNDVMYPRNNDYMSLQENMGMKKKPGFDFNRLGPRTKNPVNCSLELKKVPRGLNNITHLNNHFSKFGKIVNIQVNYEGDPEAALITFSSHAEANAAHRSTEAVLNNRFIKVFWHTNGEGKQENVPPRSVKERLGGQQTMSNVSQNTNKVLNLVQPKANTPGIGATTTTDGNTNSNEEENTEKNNLVVNSTSKSLYYIPSAKKEILADSRAQQNAAIKKGQEILAAKEQLKKKQEEKRKEAVKLTQDLIKRKQELLDKQLTQQKVLLDKLEKVPKGPQRDSIKGAIHTLQQSIEDIRKSLVAAVKQRAVNQVSVAAKISQTRKSKDEAQKELLDAELDLITKQQEGADTSDLQKKVFELKKHAQQLGIPLNNSRRGSIMPPVRIARGYKFIRGSGRHSFANASVDHRPTKLLVSGYEIEEKTDVLAHFAQYGEISDYVSDDSTPSVVLNFKTRKEAEVAMLKGKHFQDRTLSVTWCTNVQLSNQLSTNRRDSRAVLLSESDEDHLLDSIPEDELNAEGVDLSEEALLQDDEEEEEENEEDRSWRR